MREVPGHREGKEDILRSCFLLHPACIPEKAGGGARPEGGVSSLFLWRTRLCSAGGLRHNDWALLL